VLDQHDFWRPSRGLTVALPRRSELREGVVVPSRGRAASTQDLTALFRTVQPHFPAINAYLDEHDDDEPHLLGNIAEGAMEASDGVERCTGSNPFEAM